MLIEYTRSLPAEQELSPLAVKAFPSKVVDDWLLATGQAST
jgi:hypothetical protein